jgi:hypothetical protein
VKDIRVSSLAKYDNNDVASAAMEYCAAGLHPIPIDYREKGPRYKGWTDLRLTDASIPSYFQNGAPKNIGILLGIDNVGDVDLDCPEAIRAAQYFLPPTKMSFGRESKQNSHHMYRADKAVATQQYKDVDGDTMIVELRGLKEDGSVGFQTVVPPSRHKDTGEPIRFEPGCGPSPSGVDAEQLQKAVAHLAAAALLAKHWPGRGEGRNVAMMALAGGLLRSGATLEGTKEFCRAVYHSLSDPDPSAMNRSDTEVVCTSKNLESGEGEVTGWTRLSELVGADVVKLVLDWLGIAKSSKTDFDLARPLAIVPKAIALTSEIVPESIYPRIKDVSERQGSPIDMVYGFALVSLAGLINDAFRIYPKNQDHEYVLPMNLYALAVAPPGTLKTPAFKAFMKHVEQVQAHRHKEYLKETDAWLSAQANLKKGEKGDPKPIFYPVKVEDVTPERLGQILASTPRGVLVSADEYQSIFDDMHKETRKQTRNFLKKGYDGSSHQDDRVGREGSYIPRVVLSTVGGIQPKVIKRYVKDLAADGLLPRYQILVSVGRMKRKDMNRAPNADAYNRVQHLFDCFEAIDFSKGYALTFDPAAQELYMRWLEDLREREAAEPEEDVLMIEYLAKSDGTVPRLAALFELCEWADGKKSTGHISVKSTMMAIKAMAYFESHARRAFAAAMSTSAETLLLADLILEGKVKSPFSKRNDIQRKNFDGLRDSKAIDYAVGDLIRLNWVRQKDRDDPKKRGDLYEVNPDVLEPTFKKFGETESHVWNLDWLNDWQPTPEAIHDRSEMCSQQYAWGDKFGVVQPRLEQTEDVPF